MNFTYKIGKSAERENLAAGGAEQLAEPRAVPVGAACTKTNVTRAFSLTECSLTGMHIGSRSSGMQ